MAPFDHMTAAYLLTHLSPPSFYGHAYFSQHSRPPHPLLPRPKEPPTGKPDLSGPQSLVTIHVGQGYFPNRKTFTVLKSIICHYSPYFSAVFNSKLLEGETQTLDLDDVEPGTFEMMLNWMFTQRLEVSAPDQPCLNGAISYAKLWVLTDRLLLPRLQNATMSEILKPHNRSWLRTTITREQERVFGSSIEASRSRKDMARFTEYVYANTLPGSRLRAAHFDILMENCMCASVVGLPARNFIQIDDDVEDGERAERPLPKVVDGWRMKVCRVLEKAIEDSGALGYLRLLVERTVEFDLYLLSVAQLEDQLYVYATDAR